MSPLPCRRRFAGCGLLAGNLILVTDLVARAVAVIDTDAIAASVETLRASASGAEVMAVVKADGYGHGAVQSARAALAGGATWLGVALVEEAVALRVAGIDAPILTLVEPPSGASAIARQHAVDVGLGTRAALDEAAAAGEEGGTPVRVHLKVDTGLARGGATAEMWPDLVTYAAKLAAEGTVEVVAIWTHLAHADNPGHPTTGRQVAAFREALDVAASAGVRPPLRHLANSAATLTLPDAHFDLVRPGIAVYGVSPVPTEGDFGLTPAMSLRSRVALVKRVPAGTGVSYGHRYTTTSETSLALAPIGYADGVPRSATNTAEVFLGGKRRRISGTVCMDQFLVDVGDDAVETGDEIVLFGSGRDGEPTAQDWAEALDTISYEIVTRVGSRVPRRYVGASA
jgi:alanine racemase